MFVFVLWNRIRHQGRWTVMVLPVRPTSRTSERDHREPLLRRDVSGRAAAEAGVERLKELLEQEGIDGVRRRDAAGRQELAGPDGS
jgi:hypothetical protein